MVHGIQHKLSRQAEAWIEQNRDKIDKIIGEVVLNDLDGPNEPSVQESATVHPILRSNSRPEELFQIRLSAITHQAFTYLPTTTSLNSSWTEIGRKSFWLLFAGCCLSFLVWGNCSRMEGSLAENLFKASFGEILVFAAGLMAFNSMWEQAQKVLACLAGIGVSLFLTQANLSASFAVASAKSLTAQQTLHAEIVARDSLAENLAALAADHIKRADLLRVQLAAANEKVMQAGLHLSNLPAPDRASHAADLFIRLLAQLSIVLALSQLRRPVGGGPMSRVF